VDTLADEIAAHAKGADPG